jgi:hypothetical protein
MTINDAVEKQMSKLRLMKERVGWKKKAKDDYKYVIGMISEKDACSHCTEMAEKITDGDTVIIVKRSAKKFCTDDWHETMAIVEKIFDEGKKMLFIGYEKLLAGFTITKICPHCHRIISVKVF